MRAGLNQFFRTKALNVYFSINCITGGDMGSTLTARLPDELNEELDRISEEESIDKSAVTRKMLEKAVKEHKVDKALEKYEEKEVSMRKAAKLADLNLWQFIEKMKEEGVRQHYSEEDLEEDLKAVKDD